MSPGPSSTPSAPHPASALLQGHPSHNQFILIGTPTWVDRVITRLHVAHIAEAGTWSKRLPTGNPNQVISILHCQRQE